MSLAQEYLDKIKKLHEQGDYTEHSHRPALQALLEGIGPKLLVINEPKLQKYGRPDLIISDNISSLGAVETKDLGNNLDKTEKSEQLKRYLGYIPNLILTDYLEFRWYKNGEFVDSVRIASIDRSGKIKRDSTGEEKLIRMLGLFLESRGEPISSAKDLAAKMAAVAREIRIAIEEALKNEDLTDDKPDPLHDQLNSFRKTLLPNLTEPEFADLYAQTVAYGFFSARVNKNTGSFTRKGIAEELPRTNPFMRNLAEQMMGVNMPESISWAADYLAELLNRVQLDAILDNFGRMAKAEDAVVYFYENFLAEYDPKLRELRGVYYTPEPVVSYIVRSVDAILKRDFNLPDGLADRSKVRLDDKEIHRVLVLDPAVGTGTFLFGVINNIFNRFEGNQIGGWNGYVEKHLLPRVFGFELLFAPYAVAHLKLSLLLKETGYEFNSDTRLGVYLTNTLEDVFRLENVSGIENRIFEEAVAAKKIKEESPVMVIVGNPPYSGASQNKGSWIQGLIEDYKKGLDEKKINFDDFTKFIRFAQWRIEQTGYGILAFITNHNYLDAVTLRRMRESLIETFDDIYILDLHGSAMKQERPADSLKDENVFDIKQGVSIGIFIKKQTKQSKTKVFFSELWGDRLSKYEKLNQLDITTLKNIELTEVAKDSCLGKFFFFTPKAFDNIEEYCAAHSLKDIFPLFGSGIATDRDPLFYDYDYETLMNRMETFYSDDALKTDFAEKYDVKNSSSYKILLRRKNTNFDPSKIRECYYRPFENKWLYYDPELVSRASYNVMSNLERPNLALLTTRLISTESFRHVLVSKSIVDRDPLSVATKERTKVFPLYVYPTEVEMRLTTVERLPNFSDEFIREFSEKLGMEFNPTGRALTSLHEVKVQNDVILDASISSVFTPEDIFCYAYAVLHSPEYRHRYAEFLKIDFPRLPLTSNKELFSQLVRLGERLTTLHLMEADIPVSTGYPVGGNDVVEFVKYEDGKVHINKEQYFADVTKEVWESYIGGYPVCEKWLKDRKGGKKLSYDEQEQYKKIVAVLKETISLMSAIDDAIESHGGFPIT